MPFKPAKASSTDDYPLHTLSKRTSFSTQDMVTLGEAGPSSPMASSSRASLRSQGQSVGYSLDDEGGERYANGKGRKKRLSDVKGEEEEALLGVSSGTDGISLPEVGSRRCLLATQCQLGANAIVKQK